MKDALANITYKEFETIMHGVKSHTKDIVSGGKLKLNALTLDELCYWELLNVIYLNIKYDKSNSIMDLNTEEEKTAYLQEIMNRVRDCYLPFSNIFVEYYTKNGEYPLGQIITLRLNEDTIFNLKTAERFIINHYAGLYGYEVEKAKGRNSDVENLNDCPLVPHEDAFGRPVYCVKLDKRKDGQISERKIINSMMSKINGKEYLGPNEYNSQEDARG